MLLPPDLWLLRFTDRLCEILPAVSAGSAMLVALSAYGPNKHLDPEDAAERHVLSEKRGPEDA